jgi:hypothetical protein
MPFDINDQADLTALKAEQDNDPVAMGYVLTNTVDSVDKINDINQNTGPTAITRSLDDVSISETSAIIDQTEYGALPEYDKAWVDALIGQVPTDKTMREYKAKFLEIFPNGSVTRTAALALLDVEGSRAEVLFGYETVLSVTDWDASRELG